MAPKAMSSTFLVVSKMKPPRKTKKSDRKKEEVLHPQPNSTTNQTAMAQSVPPGDIRTEPNDKIAFDGPPDKKQFYLVVMINSSARRIAFAVKITNMKRLGVDPPCGVLDPKEDVILAVSSEAFTYGQEDTKNDRVVIEWINTPDGATKELHIEWFQGDGVVCRKNISIDYQNKITSLEDEKTQSDRSGEVTPEETTEDKTPEHRRPSTKHSAAPSRSVSRRGSRRDVHEDHSEEEKKKEEKRRKSVSRRKSQSTSHHQQPNWGDLSSFIKNIDSLLRN